MRWSRLLIGLATAALLGIGVFGVMLSRAVEVTDATAATAAAQFADARAPFGDQRPLLSKGDDGRLVRRDRQPPGTPGHVTRLRVLSFQAAAGRVVRAEVPFWFFRLKAPAAQIILRDTGFDLDTLGITSADLAREGPTLVLDETTASGDRLLVWTE